MRVGPWRRLSAKELMLLNWCWRRLFRVPWTARRSKPVNPKGNQSWIFIGRTDAEAEAPILRLPDAKSGLIRNDAGKDWRQEKGMSEDEMVGWHQWLDGHEFEQAPGVGDGQGSLACCSPWGRKELDMTEWLNNNNNFIHTCILESTNACTPRKSFSLYSSNEHFLNTLYLLLPVQGA